MLTIELGRYAYTHMHMQVLTIELGLKRVLAAQSMCIRTTSCECAPLDSLVNYLFPTARHAATPNASLHFDGLGLTDAAANVGLRCGVALTVDELAGVLDSHAVRTHPGFFSDGPSGADDWPASYTPSAPISANSNSSAYSAPPPVRSPPPILRRSKFLRTRLKLRRDQWYTYYRSSAVLGMYMPPSLAYTCICACTCACICQWYTYYRSPAVLGLTDVLDRAASNPYVTIHTDLVSRFWTIKNVQLGRWLTHDAALLLVAVCLIFAHMWWHFGSAPFAAMAVMQIVLSFPLMFVAVDVLAHQRPLSGKPIPSYMHTHASSPAALSQAHTLLHACPCLVTCRSQLSCAAHAACIHMHTRHTRAHAHMHTCTHAPAPLSLRVHFPLGRHRCERRQHLRRTRDMDTVSQANVTWRPGHAAAPSALDALPGTCIWYTW